MLEVFYSSVTIIESSANSMTLCSPCYCNLKSAHLDYESLFVIFLRLDPAPAVRDMAQEN